MTKKRKNPFAGKTNHTGTNANSPENMSMKELAEELRYMEKALGKEEFSRLLEEAIQKFEDPTHDNEDFLDDDFDDDDDFYDFDMVTLHIPD